MAGKSPAGGAKSERLGLLMIACSLAAILAVTGVIFHYQRQSRLAQIRVQGVGLARLLASLPYDQLVGAEGERGLLQVLRHSQGSSDLAYSAVVDPRGRLIASATAPGVMVPPLPGTSTRVAWPGEEVLRGADGQPAYREFHAPLLSEGSLAGQVRVGYREPPLFLGAEQVPFLGSLALPVFLLTPIFYFLVRREIRPLSDANEKLRGALDEGRLQPVEVHATGELADFIGSFNRFVQLAEDRMEEMELRQRKVLTSSKVLTYQKARVEAVLQALPDAALVLDESGTTAFANGKLGPLLGVDPRTVQGKRPADWCRDEELLAYLTRYGANGALAYRNEPAEFQPTHAPGRWVSACGYPLFSPKDSGELLGTLVVCRDVTHEVLARQARSEFVAHVAHELKSPLNVIGMYAEQLAGEDGAGADFRVETVNVITDEVDRLSTLIKNLLNITKIEMGSISLDRQRVKLGDLLRDVFQAVGRNGRAADLRFELDLPHELSPVSVDKDLLRIALNNLVTNAIKYNRPGGLVRLAAEESEREIRIAVTDTGIGIEPADRERIFEKFFRSESRQVRERPGNGLGLPLARDIVELHQGTVEVRSEPGRGSEFTVVLRKTHGLVQQAI